MENIEFGLATQKDREQLMDYFRHYKVDELIERRVDCYTSHSFTVVARDGDRIVGTIQWHVKEDPYTGVAEFEEFHVLEEHRDRGIGSSLIGHAIQSVKDYFEKIGIQPKTIFLFVSEGNTAARDLFEKHGFQLASKIGHLFSDDEVELLYSLKFWPKRLSPSTLAF
ncbi:MAG: GNAT family N-acetyltransferase [Methanomassiliicoccales archaeon]|nr:MAG: GNAT family N-acetyltransferase [Methanomassiliicoccales archaeon]